MSLMAPNRLAVVMNYFADAYRFASGKAAPDKRGVFYSALETMARRDQWQTHVAGKYEDVYKLAVCSAAFYSSVKIISDRVKAKEARPVVKKRKGEELVDIKNHAFELLMERPNSLMTSDFMLSYATQWYHLNGNAYFFISTPGWAYGEPEELWPLPSDAMRPLPGSLRRSRLTGKPCIDYGYTVLGEERILPGEHIIHIRNPNPFDYWQGLSFISAIQNEIRGDTSQAQYFERFYSRDNGVPTAIISLPAETDEVLFESIYNRLKSELDSGQLRLITRAGDIDVKTIAHTFQQSDFVNSRLFNIKTIRQVLGVPDGMLDGGLSGDSRLATEIAFTRNTVQPLLDMFAAEFQANIAPYYDDDIVIVAPSIIPQDRALKIQEYTTYSQDRSINENRKELGLPPVEFGDEGDEALQKMVEVPVRLIPYVSSNTYQSETDSGEYIDPAIAESGDMDGMMDPANMQQEFVGKGAAYWLGVKEELKRWRKVALSEVRRGRKASDRSFEVKAIPPMMQLGIIEQLKDVSEESIIDLVFSSNIRVASNLSGDKRD